MAGATTPNNELTFYRVKGNETGSMGSFGDTWSDISRVGLDQQRFIRVGTRGSRETVECLQFFLDEIAAKNFQEIARSMQGKEIILTEQLSTDTWQVFVHDVRSGIRAVEASGAQINGAKFMVTVILDLQLVN